MEYKAAYCYPSDKRRRLEWFHVNAQDIDEASRLLDAEAKHRSEKLRRFTNPIRKPLR